MTARFISTALVVVAFTATAPGQDKVELKDVSLADLTKAIEAHKGKPVVVDVWGEF